MRYFAISILITMLLGAFIRPLIALELIVTFHQTSQEQRLLNCENKDKPKLHCNGKCQLTKNILPIEKSSKKESKHNTKIPGFEFVQEFNDQLPNQTALIENQRTRKHFKFNPSIISWYKSPNTPPPLL